LRDRALLLSRDQIRRMLTRRSLSIALMIVGALLLAYVATEYFAMYSEQRKLSRQWQQENAGSVSGNRVDQSASGAVKDDGLTRISIPRIELDAVVVEGTSYRQLAVPPAPLQDTVTPAAH